MRARAIPIIWLFSAAAAIPASARDIQDRPVLPARVIGSGDLVYLVADTAELERRLYEARQWIADYADWKRWSDRWRNKREPGWLKPRDRRKQPDPPLWLFDDCRDIVQDQGILVDACRLLTDWTDDAVTAQLRQQTAIARGRREATKNTSWWEHLHFDALWPMTQWGAGVYGVLGMHATVEVAGRFQVFVTPGVILLNLPNGRNSREWKPATDWGIAYRCFDFTFPGTTRRGSLHLNLARAWVLTGPVTVVKSSIDLAGFSVTMKRPPQP